ncbi:MAG: AAA family ATPase, partial [Actinobacteria bacterium]|nr:AAA family ATPase [Actinomycetota bacterium]
WQDTREAFAATVARSLQAGERLSELAAEQAELATRLSQARDLEAEARLADGALIANSEPPRETDALARLIEQRLPEVDLADVLVEVDGWTAFTGHLLALSGNRSRSPQMPCVLYAAIMAQATNLGLTGMARASEFSYDQLEWASEHYLREQTLSDASACLVDYHHSLALTGAWGTGQLSSSDGQRFASRSRGPGTAALPRYFGHRRRGLQIYSWTSDQYSQYAKTFTAGALRQVYEDAGYHVIGIAPTGRAVRELAEEASVAAWTLDRALIDLQHGDALPERTVVLLDEAGMAATRSTERLLAAAEDAGAKVIAIGDSGQLPSVQAGGWMREVGQRVGIHRLTQVMRQRDLDERRALAHLHDGRSDAYLDWATNQNRVVVHTDEGATSMALADWKQAAAEHGPGQAVLIARDNATRAMLNCTAREHVRELGQLGEDVDYGPVTVAVGDRVICRRNDRFADVDNGTRATILKTSAHGVLIRTDAGPVRTLPAAYVAEHVEHAYCLTGHGMQGGTVEHATVVATPRALTRGWSYTALSRARAATRLHIDGQDVPAGQAAERAELAPHDAQPQPERDEVLARTARRMTVRDDEDLAMTQLPARPAPGRPDDDELHHPDPTATAETPGTGRGALRALRGELATVNSQRAQLPLGELRELDAIEQDITRLQGQREHVAARLTALPEPQRRLLGRTKDPHAVERAHLTTAVHGADRQLTALTGQRDRLTATTGDLPAARTERDALDRRESQLQRQVRELRDGLAEQHVLAPPGWARDTFGERPAHPRTAEQWDRGVRAIARYRIDHDIPDQTPGLGPEPKDRSARHAWRQVDDTIQQVQR